MQILIFESGSDKYVKLDARAGQSFAQAIWLSPAIKPVPLCAGAGLCGLCKLRFAEDAPFPTREEKEYFSQTDLEMGWRLACRHKIPPVDGTVTIFLPEGSFRCTAYPSIPNIKGMRSCLAFDIGTTSIQWNCLSQSGEIICGDTLPNPQAAAGPDVISRLKYALEPAQRDLLSNLILSTIGDIMRWLLKSNINPERLCIAANSVMTHILLKYDVSGLAVAPYRLVCHGGEIIDLKLATGEVPCVIPPMPAPFVGADISAGLLYCIEEKFERPFLLADLGTNAELALLLPDNKLYLASVPLGPAMEGIGPCCGRPAQSGVATSFNIDPGGLKPRFYDELHGQHISATGYLSLFSQLLNLGLMDRNGFFTTPANPNPICRRIMNGLEKIQGQKKLNISQDMYVTANDVEMLLKIKATFRIALSRLMAIADLPAGEIKSFVLAGAIGENANLTDLKNLGFIPYMLAERVIAAGNSSLKGAELLALRPTLLSRLSELCAKAVIVDMANDPAFFNDFLKELTWH